MGPEKIARVVIDTNVVVSALLFGGEPGRLLTMWQNRNLQPFLSKAILDEYLRVLAYPRFELSESEIHFLIYNQILPWFEVIIVTESPKVINADPSDDKFLHCAAAARAEALISGDHHLLKLKIYKDIKILSVTEFLRDIEK